MASAGGKGLRGVLGPLVWQGDHKDGWLAGAAKSEILNVEAAGEAGRWAGKAVVARWRRWATGRCVAYVVERSGLASVSSAAHHHGGGEGVSRSLFQCVHGSNKPSPDLTWQSDRIGGGALTHHWFQESSTGASAPVRVPEERAG